MSTPRRFAETKCFLLAVALTGSTLFLLAACSGGPRLPPLASDAVILCFGDSLTFGTGASEAESYPMRLAALTGHQPAKSKNLFCVMKLNKYLKAAQALQAKAINRNDIKMFEVDIRNYEDGEVSVWVTTQLVGSEEFHYFVLYTFFDKEQNDKLIAQLTAWMEGAE